MTNQNLQTELTAHYEWFHRHPERSYEEFATTARIQQILTDNGIEIADVPALKTGTVAVIHGQKNQANPASQTSTATTARPHVVALRGDIDALPIPEETGLPYASENPGVMHACGHDYNMTSALGAALLLHRTRDTFAGTVKVIFQPAEEAAADENTPTGSVYVLESGALADVEAIYGVHDSSVFPVGTYGIGQGPTSGAVTKFVITITGKGSHAAHPDQGASPIRAAVQLVEAIQSVAGLDVEPASPRAITVTHIEAGNTWNVIPEKALIEGTVRTLGTDVRDHFHDRFIALAHGTATSFGVDVDLHWEDGSPSVENDPALSAFSQQVAAGLGLTVTTPKPSLGGEDFSYYQRHFPGVFISAGVGTEAGGLHKSGFSPDVSGLADTATLLATLATRTLERLADSAQTSD